MTSKNRTQEQENGTLRFAVKAFIFGKPTLVDYRLKSRSPFGDTWEFRRVGWDEWRLVHSDLARHLSKGEHPYGERVTAETE